MLVNLELRRTFTCLSYALVVGQYLYNLLLGVLEAGG